MGTDGRQLGGAPPVINRILLDLTTSLAWRGRNAVGIVRTERELAARLLDDVSLDVVPVVFHNRSLRVLDTKDAYEIIRVPDTPQIIRVPDTPQPGGLAQNVTIPEQVARPARNPSQRPVRFLLSVVGKLARLLARAVLYVMPGTAREKTRLALIHAREAVRSILYPEPASAPAAEAPTSAPAAQAPMPSTAAVDLALVLYPLPSDVLFIAGLGWDCVDCVALAEIRQVSGMKIVSVFYDLIPIKFPEFLGGQPGDFFYNYFLHMIDLCDHILCISKCTQNDLLEFCESIPRMCPPASVIYLGSQVPLPPDEKQIQDERIRARLSKGRFALTVGTFEVRKNYALLLDIWRELVKDPVFDLDLVIVGMHGWNVDDVIARMEQSSEFGERIYWFKQLSDGGLSWLYERCHVFLYPSLYEGWGLPVVEATQHGRPSIVSNRGAIPEAGLGVVKIVDPGKRQEWVDAVRLAASSDRMEIDAAARIPTWDQATQVVKEALACPEGANP